MDHSPLTRAVKLALLGTSAVSITAPAIAQDSDEQELEEITVTGTRIARQDYLSASPISTVDAELFEQTGAPTIETVLNTLPQFVPAITSTSNNPDNGGQANVALRGLQEQRTLVLLDGRRIVPSNDTGVVDLNLIPASIIESVEIITGGASAVYGSDAIAGVVNIKTRDFTGLELTSNYGITSEDDGQTVSFGVTGGVESDDGRAYAFGTLNWADRESINAGDRAFSSVTLDWDGDSFEPVGSSTIPQGRWDAISSNAPTQAALDAYFLSQDPNYVAGSAVPGHNFGFNPDGSLFDTAPVINFTGDTNDPLQPVNPAEYTYNFGPVNYLQLPLERKSFFGRAGFNLNEDTELYAQVLWADYQADTALASTPITTIYVPARQPQPARRRRGAACVAPRSDGSVRVRQAHAGVRPAHLAEQLRSGAVPGRRHRFAARCGGMELGSLRLVGQRRPDRDAAGQRVEKPVRATVARGRSRRFGLRLGHQSVRHQFDRTGMRRVLHQRRNQQHDGAPDDRRGVRQRTAVRDAGG